MFSLLADTAVAADPFTTMMGSPSVKTFLTFVLVLCFIFAFAFPALAAKVRSVAEDWLLSRLQKLPAGAGGITGTVTESPEAYVVAGQKLTADDIDSIAKQRAIDLKAACPRADAALRLTWVEQGLSPEKARTAYIRMLEANIPMDTQLEVTR